MKIYLFISYTDVDGYNYPSVFFTKTFLINFISNYGFTDDEIHIIEIDAENQTEKSIDEDLTCRYVDYEIRKDIRKKALLQKIENEL